MEKFFVIFNNETVAPTSKFTEYDDPSSDLVEVEEDQINDEAWARKCTRAHLYESVDDGFGNIEYHYLTTKATTYTG